MTSTEFTNTLRLLGFESNRKAASWLGINETSVRRMASGEIPVHPTTEKLLRLMLVKSLTPEDVDNAIKSKPKQHCFMLATTDNFRPNFPGDKVLVFVTELIDLNDGCVDATRILVRGEELFEMHLDAPIEERNVEATVALAKALPNPVTIADLERLGFVRF